MLMIWVTGWWKIINCVILVTRDVLLVLTTEYFLNSVFSAKDVSGYFELGNLLKEAYLCSDNDCGRTYICKDKGSVVVWDNLNNCY